MRTATVVAMALVLLASAQAWSADALPQQLELRLSGAAFAGPEQTPGSPSLLLNVNRYGDRWERVVGTGNFNRAIHTGRVARAALSADQVALTLDMDLQSDAWVKGGRARYDLVLKRTGGNRFAGRYTGTFRGAAVKGAANAVILPPLKAPDSGFEPVRPGEHPRILFRERDLPALREKAETPFGKAAIANMTDAIGLGIRYQLTGDRKYADQARAFVERLLVGNYKEVKAPGSHHGMYHWGPVWEQAGVAYDLCYDAWPAEFRSRVEQFIVLWTYRIFAPYTMFNTQAQYDFGNHESGWFYYGPALAALAMWGEKGKEPARPPMPDAITEIPPARGYRPGRGVPVLPLVLGKAPTQWLYTRPLDCIFDGDPLAELGGAAQCRPERGTALTADGMRLVFEPLPEEFMDPENGAILNIAKSIRRSHVRRMPGPEMKKDGPLTAVFYTVLRNDEPRLVKVNTLLTRWDSEEFWLGGHLLAHGQVVELQKGLYPLTVIARIRLRRDRLTSRLVQATGQDAEKSKAVVAAARRACEDRTRDWDVDRAEWKRTGGFNQQFQELFEITRWVMYTHYREGMGTGGFQPETATSCVNVGLLPTTYTAAYRNVFGTDVSPFADASMYVPRRVFSHFYGEQGPPTTLDFNGPNALSSDLFVCNFPVIPDAMQPAMLWAWNRQAGVTGPSDAAKVLKGSIASIVHRAFLWYPLNMQAKPPKDVLPLTWEAPDYGYFGFRNAHAGKDDFLVQVYGRCRVPHGYNMPNAGTFAVQGLGQTWAHALPSLRLHNLRSFGNVVLLPEDLTNEGACGIVSYSRLEKDGSGVVTIDLRDVYAAQADKKGPLYEKYGQFRRDEAFRDSGVTGLRSIAVDYSGKSGSPCLLVLVDKIAGGKSKLWKWILTDDEKDRNGKVITPGDLSRTKVEGNAAVVTKPDGSSMRLTFVGPANPQIKAENRAITYVQTYNRGNAEMPAPGLYATGGDPTDGGFFVVVTIQRAEAPAVKVEGAGLSAKVRVGGRTVTFDGQKVLLGE